MTPPTLTPAQLDLLAAVDRGEVWLERRPTQDVAYRRVETRARRVTAQIARLALAGLVQPVAAPTLVRPDNDELTEQPYGLTPSGIAAVTSPGAEG